MGYFKGSEPPVTRSEQEWAGQEGAKRSGMVGFERSMVLLQKKVHISQETPKASFNTYRGCEPKDGFLAKWEATGGYLKGLFHFQRF